MDYGEQYSRESASSGVSTPANSFLFPQLVLLEVLNDFEGNLFFEDPDLLIPWLPNSYRVYSKYYGLIGQISI